MANPACIVAGRCAFAASSCGSNRQATRQLHAAAITGVTRLINWNQWRVQVSPQRVQTDCTGRNCSPQFSQNKCASPRDWTIARLPEAKARELLYLGTGLPNPPPCPRFKDDDPAPAEAQTRGA